MNISILKNDFDYLSLESYNKIFSNSSDFSSPHDVNMTDISSPSHESGHGVGENSNTNTVDSAVVNNDSDVVKNNAAVAAAAAAFASLPQAQAMGINFESRVVELYMNPA